MTAQQIKQKFGIIGASPALDRAIETAIRVAPTDLSVLITGESGAGKEIMPQIIHQQSARKHGSYIAVNCGAIPEGTIESELFGHEKGAFTGAHDSRKGYFEVANGGTIFLDEVAELPIQTQVRLLRVLETGEFMKVGSSKVIKTDVRVVTATNVNIPEAIEKGRFREDLYYRLNTVPIVIPALRERKEDIHLIFRKFAADFAEKYRMPAVRLSPDAIHMLENHRWPGNIRQLKNITEQISIIAEDRNVDAEQLRRYLPTYQENKSPALYQSDSDNFSERDILYKVLFDMKKDMNDLKKLVVGMINNNGAVNLENEDIQYIQKLTEEVAPVPASMQLGSGTPMDAQPVHQAVPVTPMEHNHITESEVIEESLSLADKEIELIKKALEKYRGKRKLAADELGISERTLYRKIKEYNLTQ